MEYTVVDSSGWLEYLATSDRAELFAPAIEATTSLVVPLISVYEVYKVLLREEDLEVAERARKIMLTGRAETLTEGLVIAATKYALPMADSLIYATAQQFGATLWTQDAHFEGLPGVRYFPKPPRQP